MLTLRAAYEDDWRAWRDVRLWALEDAPGAFGARLSDWEGGAEMEPRWRDRLRMAPFNLLAAWGPRDVGQVSALGATSPGGPVELISMWVAPQVRGRGVANALVEEVIGWAHRTRAAGVELAVRRRNERAIALYRRHGFVVTGPAASPDEQTMAMRFRLH